MTSFSVLVGGIFLVLIAVIMITFLIEIFAPTFPPDSRVDTENKHRTNTSSKQVKTFKPTEVSRLKPRPGFKEFSQSITKKRGKTNG